MGTLHICLIDHGIVEGGVYLGVPQQPLHLSVTRCAGHAGKPAGIPVLCKKKA